MLRKGYGGLYKAPTKEERRKQTVNHVKGVVSGGWDSQNDSGRSNLKSLESSLSYSVASGGPPGAASCEWLQL